jgi:Ca2+/H+ antiporter
MLDGALLEWCCKSSQAALTAHLLATLLSHATESVAAKTGDTVGGLLNATLGITLGGQTVTL